ncbi:DUF4065 domain-containing protein [Macrococcoides caseolyticum]|uniref:Type II toxin-antitoxin system antitoxin SocA domain-containing protein n=1 Tax=Macrococcus psychrotolerans TaxID=3039389 RepID=A0AAT9P3I9_9STAP|nr:MULTISPECIES: type II toxin-antitoxin system antitoxin SocA domain-containing protein [Macrococcus]QYA31962.1 DUF4065 domain-containing protein [Macrococcus sp. 19Msa1099]QYA36768.1 DUF4065 domain-containing protein [Macrococcus caseolyticus]QYA75476.1 DUF4065 domain-containing protein [Macrococcus caseolyticus]
MKELANMILTRANETNTPVTNLHLQKVMYFLLVFMADTPKYNEQARELFNQGNLQAWPYGPVDPGVYQDYKKFKDRPIKLECDFSPITSIDETLTTWIDKLLKINVFSLVRLSHEHRFWANNEDNIKKGFRPEYTFDDIVGAMND